jgi:hypothetical protein
MKQYKKEAERIRVELDPEGLAGMSDLILTLELSLDRLYEFLWLTDKEHKTKKQIKKLFSKLVDKARKNNKD